MAILDELIEKKDILAYIDFRVKLLAENIKRVVKCTTPKLRQKGIDKICARITELKYLKNCINKGIKQSSIQTAIQLGKFRPRIYKVKK